jgi:repressor LexA
MLTEKQRLIFECIKAFKEKNDYIPTVRELCTLVGLNSPATVHYHIKALERKGYIKRINERYIKILKEN